MFGYIRPCTARLSEHENALFKSYYCGLCRCLGSDYGPHCKALLSYECVFLALLMDSLDEPEGVRCGRCFIPPFRARRFAEGPALHYAAALNVLLAYHKIQDDCQDDRQVRAWLSRFLFRSAYAAATARYSEAAAIIAVHMASFNRLEAERPDRAEGLAHICGLLLQDVFQNGALLSPYREALGWAGYHTGRWVYLVDAFDDLKEDWIRGRYNPFLGAFRQDIHSSIDSFRESLVPELERQLFSSLDEIAKSLFLIKPPHHAAILSNLVHDGMGRGAARLLQGPFTPFAKNEGRLLLLR